MTSPNPFQFFTDPVLRASALGSILMCFASSLVGVLVLVRRRSLLGEALSHAAYPGVVLSALIAAAFFPTIGQGFSWLILVGAFVTALVGLWAIDFLERHVHVKNDAALCFILSFFFGVGVLIASRIQLTHTLWYKQIQIFLYGQAATLTESHLLVYGVLVVVAVALLTLLYRPVELTYFDRGFAQSVGVRAKSVDLVLFILLVFAIVIGLRSVGVVLMAGMLIAPAVSARQFTHRLPSLFALSSFFGVVSAFGGNYFSLLIPQWVSKGEGRPFSLPTGPMILLCSALIAFFCLLFAPERGVVNRYFRLRSFKRRCQVENALKTVHRKGKERSFSLKELHESGMSAFLVMRHLLSQGLAEKCKEHGYALTPKGKELAIRVVHMHRLWAAYLIFLGHGVVKTHCTVEEMEYILTPELEKELTTLMKGGEDESLLGD